jgi:tetratricopeptide (TPR) repeat protein
MTRRRVYLAGLALLLLLNTLSGMAKVTFSSYRESGESALARAELDQAFESLRSSLMWQRGNSPSHVLIGRVLRLSMANGIQVKALEGAGPEEILGVGTGSVGRGIVLSPSDAWAWFNLAEVYRGFQLGRNRRERMGRLGRSGTEVGAGEQAAAEPLDGERPVDGDAAAGEETVADEDVVAAVPPQPEAAPRRLEPEDSIIIAATAKALELEPVFFFYHDFLARLYWERGLAEDAAREARVSFSLMPLFSPHILLDDEEILQGLAGPILEGVRLAGSIPGIEPVVVARGQAEVDERLGRNAEALAAYDRFLELGGGAVEAECRYAQARLYHREGQYEESLGLLERVTQIDEDGNWGIGALRLLGVAHAELGDHDSAIDALRRFRAKRPEALAPLILLADGLRRAGNEEEAGRLYLVAVRRFPDAPMAYRRLIGYLERTEQYDEALKYARRLHERLPHDESAEALVQRLRTKTN